MIRPSRLGDALSALILLLASALGVWALVRPFFAAVPSEMPSQGQGAPWIFVELLVLCLVVLVAQLETRRADARWIAVLGVLVGLNACLRLISGPLGANVFFVLPLLGGFVFGADFGFLLAALSMLASALLMGGVGPWLPFQMLGAGWCGLVAGWLPRRLSDRAATLLLATWGAASAFVYGAVLNLWFWPYLTSGASPNSFEPGLGLAAALGRYALFYLATSSWWDAGRALGTATAILLFGPPILRLLRRFARRFTFEVEETASLADRIVP